MTVVVDSDILIEVFCARNAAVVAKWTELSGSDAVVLYSPVSVAEIWAGARPSERAALTGLFATLTCTPLDEKAACAVANKSGAVDPKPQALPHAGSFLL
jgi:predicted nucleic acid-binding protein